MGDAFLIHRFLLLKGVMGFVASLKILQSFRITIKDPLECMSRKVAKCYWSDFCLSP